MFSFAGQASLAQRDLQDVDAENKNPHDGVHAALTAQEQGHEAFRDQRLQG